MIGLPKVPLKHLHRLSSATITHLNVLMRPREVVALQFIAFQKQREMQVDLRSVKPQTCPMNDHHPTRRVPLWLHLLSCFSETTHIQVENRHNIVAIVTVGSSPLVWLWFCSIFYICISQMLNQSPIFFLPTCLTVFLKSLPC